MPSELLLNNTEIKNTKEKDNKDQVTVNVKESDLLVALRVESDSEMQNEIDDLKTVLTDDKSTTDEKNKAYEKIKNINNTRSEEEKLEKIIKDEFNLNSFIKIDDDQIKVTVESEQHDTDLANKIMRILQGNYQDNKYISVKFQK